MQFSIFISPFVDWTPFFSSSKNPIQNGNAHFLHLQWKIYWEDEKIWRMNEMWRRFNTNFYSILTTQSYYAQA